MCLTPFFCSRRAWMSHSPLWLAKSCRGLPRAPCDAQQWLALGQRSPCRYFHKYFPSISWASCECLFSIKCISQANCCSPSMNKSVALWHAKFLRNMQTCSSCFVPIFFFKSRCFSEEAFQPFPRIFFVEFCTTSRGFQRLHCIAKEDYTNN